MQKLKKCWKQKKHYTNNKFFLQNWKNGKKNINILCYNFWTNLKYRPVQHLKMIFLTLVLWKILYLAKKLLKAVFSYQIIL